MWFVVIGTVLIVLKLLDVGPLSTWPWWAALLPYGLAVIWWWIADASGWTKRREMAKDDERKLERRRRNIDALGLTRKDKRR